MCPQFGCCGGVAYVDWSQNMYFNCSKDNPSRERCSVPFSCCIVSKDKVTFLIRPFLCVLCCCHVYNCLLIVCVLEQMVINTMCGQGKQELEYIEAGKYIHANGCIDKLVNWIHSNLFLLGGIAMGLAIPQVKYTYQHTHTHTVLKSLRVECYNQLVIPVFSSLQLVGILLSQLLINQIKEQIELQNYNLKHSFDPWS